MHAQATIASLATLPKAFLLTFSALFSIVNPVVNAVIFSQMTADRTRAERRHLARRVSLYSLGLLLFSLWLGSYVLNFFGITLGALKVAGGLVIAVGAWHLLHAPERREEEKQKQLDQEGRTAATENIGDIAFFIHFLPTFVAGSRHVANFWWIFLINLFFGWTLIGWVVALVWAATDTPRFV